MIKSDRTFQTFGTTFGLHSDSVPALDALEERSRWLGWRPAPQLSTHRVYSIRLSPSNVGAQAAFDLDFNGAPLRRSVPLDLAVDAFEDHAKIQTALHAEELIFVHAGAVVVHGRGVILPGASRAGKSTLVNALLEAGATYYSDEFALLDRSGRLHPYTLPLSLRAGDHAPSRRIWPAATAPASPEAIVPVRLIVVTSYVPDAPWVPRTLSPADALLALISHTVAAEGPPARTMPVLREAVLHARTLAGDRGAAGPVAESLVSLLA